MGGQHLVAGNHLLDGLFAPIGHADLGALGQTLIFIAHDAQVVVLPRQVLHQQVLGAVGVLVLVHQNVFEALGIDGLHRRVPEEPLGPEQQVIEVAGAVVLQALLVEVIGLQYLAGPGIQGLLPGLLGQQTAVLEIADELQHPLGVVLLLGQLQLRQHLLDEALLVRGVEDHEVPAHGRAIALPAQDAGAETVEGAHPHLAGRHRDQPRHAVPHFLRGLVGEGHGQDGARMHALLFDEPGDSPGDHRGLARSGAREDEQGAMGVLDRLPLGRIQILEKGMFGRFRAGAGHGSMLPRQGHATAPPPRRHRPR